MAELLLVNPKKRRRKTARRRRKGRMPAALAAYWAGKKRRSNPHRHKARRRRRNPSYRAHHRRRRRNPSFRNIGGRLMPTIKSGFTGAVGGVMNDLILGQVQGATWLPSMLASGLGWTAVKIAGALAVGFAGHYVWRSKAKELADGAMTTVLYSALKAQLQGLLPTSLPLAQEYLTFAPTVGYTQAHNPGMQEYITGDMGNPDFYGQNYPGAVGTPAGSGMGLYLS